MEKKRKKGPLFLVSTASLFQFDGTEQSPRLNPHKMILGAVIFPWLVRAAKPAFRQLLIRLAASWEFPLVGKPSPELDRLLIRRALP